MFCVSGCGLVFDLPSLCMCPRIEGIEGWGWRRERWRASNGWWKTNEKNGRGWKQGSEGTRREKRGEREEGEKHKERDRDILTEKWRREKRRKGEEGREEKKERHCTPSHPVGDSIAPNHFWAPNPLKTLQILAPKNFFWLNVLFSVVSLGLISQNIGSNRSGRKRIRAGLVRAISPQQKQNNDT